MNENDQPQSFESALLKLQDVIAQLEKADLPLEEAIKLYEEGKNLSKLCAKILEDAQLRVNSLSEGELKQSPGN